MYSKFVFINDSSMVVFRSSVFRGIRVSKDAALYIKYMGKSFNNEAIQLRQNRCVPFARWRFSFFRFYLGARESKVGGGPYKIPYCASFLYCCYYYYYYCYYYFPYSLWLICHRLATLLPLKKSWIHSFIGFIRTCRTARR